MIKVKDLFHLNQNFKEISIIGGSQGVERIIQDIEVMEVPDGVYWVTKGDFVITTGYMFAQNQNSLENIIHILHNKQAAALGIKVGRFIDRIPENILQLADQLSFPILEIPVHLGYSDFIWSIVSKLLSDKNYDNFLLEQFRNNLQQLTHSSYSIDNILHMLNSYIEKPIILLSSHYQLVSSILNDHPETVDNLCVEKISELVRVSRNTSYSSEPSLLKEDNKTLSIFPLSTPDEPLGFLCIIDDDEGLTKNNIDFKLVKEIVPYIVISILFSCKNDILHYLSKEDFLKNLIFSNYINKNVIKAESEYFQLPLIQPLYLWILEIKDQGKPKHDSTIEVEKILTIIQQRYSHHHFLLHQHKIIVISPKTQPLHSYVQFDLENLLKHLKSKFSDLQFSIGISKEHQGLELLKFAFQEAKLSLDLGSKLYNSKKVIYSYDDFILYHLLFEVSNHPVITNIYNSTVKPIKDFDLINDGNLFETLATFIKDDFNISSTAKTIFIHRNTLYNRLQKINEITGYNIEDSEAKLIFHFGLKINDIYSINN